MDHLKNALAAKIQSGNIGFIAENLIFQIIYSHIKDMVFVMEVDDGPCFRYLFTNQTGSIHAGLSSDAIGKSIEEVMPKEIAGVLQTSYEKVLSTKKEYIFIDESQLSNGKKFNGESVLTPIEDENGDICYIVAVTRDITQSVVEKNRLILIEQRFRSIVDHNLDGILIVDTNGKVEDTNPSIQNIFGLSKQQMRKRSIFDMVAQTDVECFRKLLGRTKMGEASESYDCRFVHRKGHHLTLHIKTVPIVIHSEVEGIYVIVRDLSDQVKNAEKINFMAFHDQLTGLLNRRALLTDTEKLILKAKETGGKFSLLSIDLDRFKQINDSLGHLAGDEILQKVAERLIEFRSDSCEIYRQGGDEFIILFSEMGRQETSRLAKNILIKFSKPFFLHFNEYYITPSIGISVFPSDGKDVETLIKNADEALFRVKEKGKAHFQFYRSEMNSLVTNVVKLETNLRRAIEQEELMLYYQPQVDFQTKEINSYEALLRWKNSEFGFVSPGDFIPIAEDTGLILPIGKWVIDTACQQIKKWEEAYNKRIKIAINISPKQFMQPNLVEIIQNSIARNHIDPSLLEIEITEGAMEDTKETVPILKRLKCLGVKISVDDFGTGYSSLNYIKQFPIDVLKIDQSFVRDVIKEKKDAAITSTIIHLGQSLGIEVIAEGVETKEQEDFLIQAKCHKGQGFYYSKPACSEEIERRFFQKRKAVNEFEY